MNIDLLGAIAVIMTVIFLFMLRKLILSIAKGKRDEGHAREIASGNYGLEIAGNQSAYEESKIPVDAINPGAPFIEINEFLAELRSHAAALKRKV